MSVVYAIMTIFVSLLGILGIALAINGYSQLKRLIETKTNDIVKKELEKTFAPEIEKIIEKHIGSIAELQKKLIISQQLSINNEGKSNLNKGEPNSELKKQFESNT